MTSKMMGKDAEDSIFMRAESRTKDEENVVLAKTTGENDSKEDEVEMYDPCRDEDNNTWIQSRLNKLHSTKPVSWRYKNEQGKIFGPFTSKQMSAWVRGGYFPSSLMVSSSNTSSFVPLSTLKNPFTTKKKVVLSCPCCFVTLSYQALLLSRRSKTTYVASETVNCRVNTNERLESATTTSTSLHPLMCLSCGTEVGTCNLERKTYTFLQCIPGY